MPPTSPKNAPGALRGTPNHRSPSGRTDTSRRERWVRDGVEQDSTTSTQQVGPSNSDDSVSDDEETDDSIRSPKETLQRQMLDEAQRQVREKMREYDDQRDTKAAGRDARENRERLQAETRRLLRDIRPTGLSRRLLEWGFEQGRVLFRS